MWENYRICKFQYKIEKIFLKYNLHTLYRIIWGTINCINIIMIKEQSIYTIRLNRQFILLSHILKPLQEIWTKVSSDRDPCLNNKTKKIKKKKIVQWWTESKREYGRVYQSWNLKVSEWREYRNKFRNPKLCIRTHQQVTITQCNSTEIQENQQESEWINLTHLYLTSSKNHTTK